MFYLIWLLLDYFLFHYYMLSTFKLLWNCIFMRHITLSSSPKAASVINDFYFIFIVIIYSTLYRWLVNIKIQQMSNISSVWQCLNYYLKYTFEREFKCQILYNPVLSCFVVLLPAAKLCFFSHGHQHENCKCFKVILTITQSSHIN